MSDINEYLKWRGDITFDYDPFNEVDSLILSELAYCDFDHVVLEDDEPTELKTIRKRYFRVHDREEVKKRTVFNGWTPLLLDSLYESKRFENLKIGYFVNRKEDEKDEQFSAVTFELNDQFRYVAFRGTDNSVTGWKEDLLFSYKSGTPGQLAARDYLNHYCKDYDGILHVGGHSKGGNLAVYSAAFCEKSIQDKITDIWSNDGPGFLQETIESIEYQRIKNRIHSYIPRSSIIGLLMNNDVDHCIIQSTGKGAYQHNALTWVVEKNHFVRAEEFSNGNLFLDKTIEHWLDGLEDEDKEEFLEYVFSILDAPGDDYIEEIKQHGLKSARDMFKAGTSINKEQLQKIAKVVGHFIASGSSTIFDSLKNVGNTDKDKKN